jgi:uncharacterized membrane protein
MRDAVDVLRTRAPALVALAAGAAAALWYALVLVRRDGMLLAHAYDQAFFQAVVWNAGHGHGFFSAFWPADFLGLHFSPLLAVPAALELLWTDPRLLSVLNAVAIGTAAPAAYLLLSALAGDAPGGRILAAALGATLPLWVLLQRAAVAGFHTEAVALPLVLLSAWAGVTGRLPAMFALAAAALCAKEDQAYAVFVAGLAVAAAGRPRAGLALAAVAAVWWVAVTGVVMPALRGGVPSQVKDYYSWLYGADVGQIGRALTQPAGWLALLTALAAAAFLPLLRPWWLLAAVPPMLADLLSRHATQPGLELQYGLPLVVPIVVAAGFGARTVLARLPEARLAWAAAVPALLLAGLGPLAARDWLPAGGEPGAFGRLAACSRPVPPAAAVAADDSAAAPLASRPALVTIGDATPAMWVVVDRRGALPTYVDRARRQQVLRALPADGRRLVCDDGRFQVWSPAGA